MRVLRFNDVYEGIGGAATYFLSINQALKEKGYDIRMFSFGKKEVINEKEYIYKESRENLIKRNFSSYIFDPKVYFSFRRFLKKIKPDLIHLHQNIKSPNAILMAIKKEKIATVATFQDYTVVCPKGWCTRPNGKICSGGNGLKCFGCVPFHHFLIFFLFSWFRSYLNKKAITCPIAPTRKLKEWMERNGFRDVFYLPYFLDLKKWKFSLKKRKNNILVVARLRKEKGVDYLIKAMPFILMKAPDARLIVIGSRDYREDIEKKNLIELTKKLGLESKVSFLSNVASKELPRYYHKAKVTIVPSIWMELFGLVGIESLACGTPCVASNIGGIPEWLIDGKNGYLAEPRNPRQIAEKVIKILKDEKLAKRMAVYGRRKVEKEFNIKRHLEGIDKIYRFAIEKHKKTSLSINSLF